ncbi:predicted protein [Streptomyces sp. C]|nr:predicted protein [Streptomyces sp. C]
MRCLGVRGAGLGVRHAVARRGPAGSAWAPGLGVAVRRLAVRARYLPLEVPGAVGSCPPASPSAAGCVRRVVAAGSTARPDRGGAALTPAVPACAARAVVWCGGSLGHWAMAGFACASGGWGSGIPWARLIAGLGVSRQSHRPSGSCRPVKGAPSSRHFVIAFGDP